MLSVKHHKGQFFSCNMIPFFSDSIDRGKAARRSTLWRIGGIWMEQNSRTYQNRSWITIVLTDVHFWVPVAVLIGGLLLLRFIH